MPAYGFGSAAVFAFSTPIAVGTGTTTLVAAPGAGRNLVVQGLIVAVTTSAAQAFDIEDGDGTIEVFKAPSSLAAGVYAVDPGVLGVALTANTTLRYTATAGVGLTVSGFGYIREA